MKLYKLTDELGQTYGGTQWGEDVEHTASGTGKLCSAGWIHAYEDLLVGVFLNPIHGDFKNPQAWECDGDVGEEDHGLKVGCTRLRTLHRVELPVVTTEQRVRFGILCARQRCTEPSWVVWADKWLNGEDRSDMAVWAEAAAWAAGEAPGWAVWAARAVMWTEEAVEAEAAVWVTRAAVRAEGHPLDLPLLARKAIEEEPNEAL